MTTLTGCPEPILLSQLLDRELAEEEENGLRRHVETCIEVTHALINWQKQKIWSRQNYGMLFSPLS